jgi:short-subunit dehydrogenase
MTAKRVYTLITGASSGIGRAFAGNCASRKMHLVLVALPESGLEAYGEELRVQHGVEVHTLSIDLTRPNAPGLIFEECRRRRWHVNMLINNAGLGNVGAFENADFAGIQYMMALNMNALTGLTHLFLDQIKASGNGFILNVGSMGSFFPIPYKSIYCATKSFVYSFSRSLYFELEQHQVMVSCLCPGPTATNGQVLETNRRLGWRVRYLTLTASQVADIAIEEMLDRKFLIVPGWTNKLTIWLGKISPNALLLRYLGKAFTKPRPASASSPTTNNREVVSPLPPQSPVQRPSGLKVQLKDSRPTFASDPNREQK